MILFPVFLSSLFLYPGSNAAGLYTKNSPVLQVDSKNYDKLIAKSNYTSILEFYAPWCGHCQNLKPAFEKVASSLSGYAKVAAVNCDEDSNKPFCSSFGVQGFPTLKLVKPSSKSGKPRVEDYQGARSAKAISDAVLDKIPNHVTKVKDDTLEEWLKKSERPKALFFVEKASVSPLVKSIAIDFLGSMDVAQIRSTEETAVVKFNVGTFPQVLFLKVENKEPVKYDGEIKKDPIKKFFSQYTTPNPEFPSPKSSSKGKQDSKTKSDSKSKKESKQEPAASAASETLKEESDPSESPNPNVASDSPDPINLPVEPAPQIESLDDEDALQKTCLNQKAATCILALLSPNMDPEKSSLTGLNEIAHKHTLRGSKLFPFYAIPDSNGAGRSLAKTLGLEQPKDVDVSLIAVNAKRSWWNAYKGKSLGQGDLETWIDNIRFGDFKKEQLPEGVVQEVSSKATEEKPKKTEVLEDEKDEL